MKVLKAKNYIDGLTVQEFKVTDVMTLATGHWLMKRMPDFRETINKHGMLWPIIVTDHIHFWHSKRPIWPQKPEGGYKEGLAVHTGNKRLVYARENNYDLIEGYFVKSKDEQVNILVKTFITKDMWPK